MCTASMDTVASVTFLFECQAICLPVRTRSAHAPNLPSALNRTKAKRRRRHPYLFLKYDFMQVKSSLFIALYSRSRNLEAGFMQVQ